MAPPVQREPWGTAHDGTPIERFTLADGAGLSVGIITFGAAVQSLLVPGRDGQVADVVLGFDTADGYLARRNMFGASVGRYANRIAGAAFSLDDHTFHTPANNGPNTLHGGPAGFDRHNWAVDTLVDGDAPSLTLSRISPDGEEGFPGTLQARLCYSLPAPGTLAMEWTATTDRPTVVNMTHHGFWDLAGPATHDDGILAHEVQIMADAFLPVDAGSIPVGGPVAVAGTPFDFRHPTAVGARIRNGHEQVRLSRGYDHNWCLPGGCVDTPRLAARVRHPGSGRTMELLTDQPGLQFYSGNYLDGTVAAKGNRLCRQGDALCLEPQLWPDTPNRPDFPSPSPRGRLQPGAVYRHRSVFRFSTS